MFLVSDVRYSEHLGNDLKVLRSEYEIRGKCRAEDEALCDICSKTEHVPKALLQKDETKRTECSSSLQKANEVNTDGKTLSCIMYSSHRLILLLRLVSVFLLWIHCINYSDIASHQC